MSETNRLYPSYICFINWHIPKMVCLLQKSAEHHMWPRYCSIGDNFGEDWAYWLVIGHTICGDPCPMVELPTAANQLERQRRVDHQEYALGHCFYLEHLEEMMRLRQERISAATDELLHKLRVVDEANGRELARWNNAAAPVVVWRGYNEPTACG